MSLIKLKKQVDTIYDKLVVEQDKLNMLVQLKGYEDYNVEAVANHSRTVITIQHKEFNWTNFLTVTIEDGDFDFSHGSGGFRDSTVKERLKATQDMFKIVEMLQNLTKDIEIQHSIIKKIGNELTELREQYRDLATNEAMQKAETELKKDHTKIEKVEDVLNSIKGGGAVKLYSIMIDSDFSTTISSFDIENKAKSGARANYYFSDTKYTKKDLVSRLNARAFYTKN